ncbi:translation initiation factor IF-2-like [Panicum miliaceum]|uniref:Translation initiation factor IF-2-like n=1 Tax=Panicum miliaceum TaxID=4540 RepID=A0A3L6RH30_PANMI|nr:translation initiation factor IF-2-like [Panicum miliaceum]
MWIALQALQECSRGKSDFLRLGQERLSAERQRTEELAAQVASAQQVIDDLRSREQRTEELAAQVAAAQQVIDDLRRREQVAQDELQAAVEQARLDRVDFQATVEKPRLDAAELVRVKEEHEALQKTVERIRHERQQAWQDRDLEATRRVEAEKMVADLGTEVGQLQTVVTQGLDRERALMAQSEGKALLVCLPLWC